MNAGRAIARRIFRRERTRTISFTLLFFVLTWMQAVGYRHTYPTTAERLQFATSFGDNKAIRLFYGVPHDLIHVGGYVSWRIGGTLALFVAVWGLFAATAAFRGEEEAGRWELILAAPVTRRTGFLATLGAVAGAAGLLWLAVWLGCVVSGLAAGASAYLALEVLLTGLFFVGVGALTSQLAPTRRFSVGLGMAVFGVAFAIRIVADTSAPLDWMRWLSPLGWAEEMRPFTGPQPWAALPLIVGAAASILLAARLALHRDVGNGLLRSRDRSEPRDSLLSSPTALALRGERGMLAGWVAGISLYAIVAGLLADTFNTQNLSQSFRDQIERLGGASLVTAKGALGFYFLMFAFAISLFACAQIAAARREEAGSRLETLFSLPVSRWRWLGGRLALACAGGIGLALAAAVLSWAAAGTQGAGVPLSATLEAGLNCLPAAALFLGLAALAFALVPRAAGAIAYGLVSVAFCWYLFGALLGAPQWSLDLSPFQHVALVPAQPFKVPEALAMAGVGALAAGAAVAAFRRRDILGA